MNEGEIYLKVLKIRLDSLLKMPKTPLNEKLIERIKKEITKKEELIKK